MAPFSSRAEKYGRSGKNAPAWSRGPRQLLTLQRNCVFSDALSTEAGSQAGFSANNSTHLHSVSTVSGASTSSSRSRVFNSSKISSFVGWGLRYAEFAGTLPLGRSSLKGTLPNEPLNMSQPERHNATRSSQRLRKTRSSEKPRSKSPTCAEDAEQKTTSKTSRLKMRRNAIAGVVQTKLHVKSAIRYFGREHVDKLMLLRQVTSMDLDDDEQPQMTMAEMIEDIRKQTGLGKEEVEDMHKLFQKYDKDDSGVLDKTEVKKVLTDFGLEPKTREERTEINELFLEVDQDGSGEFSFTEFALLFVRIRERLKELQQADLQSKFLEADEDGSGDLDMSEVMTILKQLGYEPKNEDEEVFVQQIVNEVDADGSGEINLEEFQALISQVRDRLTKHRRAQELTIKTSHSIDEILFREFRPELRDLLASFQRYDKDHSGVLDQEESMMVLSDAGLLPKTRADRMMIDELMADMDTDDDGCFTFREFLDLTYRMRKLMKEKDQSDMMALFQKYDSDGSGELGPPEIFKILEDYGMLPKTREEQEEIKAVLEEVDADGSGNLEFDEFQVLMSKVRQNLSRLQKDSDRKLAQELGFNDDQVKDFRKAFDKLDPDGGGSLTIMDIRQVLRLLRVNISSDELRTIFDQLDEDGSGSLEFAEFLRFVKTVEDNREQLRKSVHRAPRTSSITDLTTRTLSSTKTAAF